MSTELTLNLSAMKNYGSLKSIISQVNQNDNLMNDVKNSLIVRASMDSTLNREEVPSIISQVLSVSKYLLTLPVKSADDFFDFNIAVVGHNTYALIGPFPPMELHRMTNEWDYLLSYDVKGLTNSTLPVILATILWNMTFQGYPEEYLNWYKPRFDSGEISEVSIDMPSNSESIGKELLFDPASSINDGVRVRGTEVKVPQPDLPNVSNEQRCQYKYTRGSLMGERCPNRIKGFNELAPNGEARSNYPGWDKFCDGCLHKHTVKKSLGG